MQDDTKLLAFALGTFHTVLLTLVLLLPLFLYTDLGETLEDLSTLIGLAVFAALWVTSVYCTLRALCDARLTPGAPVSVADSLRGGEIWGAWNGVLFFWCLLVGSVVAVVVSELDDGLEAISGAFFVAVLGFGTGTVVAAIFGAAIGFVFAVLDMLLLWAARSIAGAGTPSIDPDTSTPASGA